MKQIMAAYAEITSEVAQILDIEIYGSTTGHGFYIDGSASCVQCDFGFNISKEHFDEFALPYLREEMDFHDAIEYHLDGPGNITHLESICALEALRVIQWVPGAGDELQRDWTWLFEKIDALGQGLWLSAGSPEAAVALWEKYDNSGRMILNVNAADRDAMQRYLDAFEKLGR
jgi:5-methyltetrahydrofolate--homocysteine methyltransferase